MPKTEKKKTTKAVTAKKRKSAHQMVRAKKWNQQHLAVSRLLESELNGLIQYLRAIHYLSIIIIISVTAALIFALRTLFQSDQHAVVGFLFIILTSILVILLAAWALKPWVLPRYLLPMDLNGLEVKQLMDLFQNPNEYLQLLKNHTQVLTEQFLLPKLRRIRNAIILLVFGIATAILLSIALP